MFTLTLEHYIVQIQLMFTVALEQHRDFNLSLRILVDLINTE